MIANIDQTRLEKICQKFGITELSLFGSAIRDDFSEASDIDILVNFEKESVPTLFRFEELRLELQELFGRDIDLLTKRSIEKSRNRYRRQKILGNHRVIYAA
ncbi:MAG: hypothetical protein HBSAPP04_13430 [Ignavibacteriaceae bacterium]|nr:MAG: hypothetical protein EDM75_08385 [Chlorobiota bacterium]GJQ32504.1 MAG: hypothetical protein HBSAPP04_13430 [Ignavibacteriaceae bacterium]